MQSSSLESFVYSVFSNISWFDKYETKKYASEAEAKNDIFNVGPRSRVVKQTGSTLHIFCPTTHDSALWRQILYLGDCRPVRDWALEVNLPEDTWHVDPKTNITFVSWMTIVLDRYGWCMPPARPVYIQHMETIVKPQTPAAFLIDAMKKELNEFQPEDVEHLCKQQDAYVQTLKLLSSELKHIPEIMSVRIKNITDIFTEYKKRAADTVAIAIHEEYIAQHNKEIDESNAKIYQEHRQHAERYDAIYNQISNYFYRHVQ